MTPKLPSKWRQELTHDRIVSDSHPQTANATNTININNRQRQRPVLKAVNGESRKERVKRKAPGDDEELIR